MGGAAHQEIWHSDSLASSPYCCKAGDTSILAAKDVKISRAAGIMSGNTAKEKERDTFSGPKKTD